jgi:hypothetical protein
MDEVSVVNIPEPLFCFSKKYYAGGEIVIEFITQENKEVDTRVEVTCKKGEDVFQLKKKYRIVFTEIKEA